MGEHRLSLSGQAGSEVPLALAELHHALLVGELVTLDFGRVDEDFVRLVVVGAGFEIVSLGAAQSRRAPNQTVVTARRLWTLPDVVGPHMALLVCGLNPSPDSADAGIGFHRAGNRFWPAALQAGLVSKDRDPRHALHAHGMGMTDLVKRATRRADELSRAEFTAGIDRVARLVEWLRPEAICMVGLAGWRATIDRTATAGWQPIAVGDRPVYLMPSTSGLNAHDTVDTLAGHLRLAVQTH